MVVRCRQSRGFIYLPPFPSPCCVFLPLDSEPDGLDAEMAELASLGFTGCLSGVHFNSISPLKAALLHPDSPVIVTGPLVQSSCGSSSPANTYAAETTHSLSGTGSKVSLCMLFMYILLASPLPSTHLLLVWESVWYAFNIILMAVH